MRETPDELDPARRPRDRYGAISSASVPPLGGAARHAYDPNQPRVPAGHHEGGQWTNKPGSGTPSQRREAILDRSGKESWHSYVNTYRPEGSLAQQRVFNRDGSRIVSEFGDGSGRFDERNTVVTADRRKFVFENRGGVQTVYDEDGRPISVSAWTDNGPESPPSAQLAFAPAIPAAAATIEALAATTAGRIATQKAIEATLLLFTWLSRWNGPDGIAVMSFPAYVFERDKAKSDAAAKGEAAPISVRRVTEEEVKKACDKLTEISVDCPHPRNRALHPAILGGGQQDICHRSEIAAGRSVAGIRLWLNLSRSGEKGVGRLLERTKTFIAQTGRDAIPQDFELAEGRHGKSVE